MASLNSFDLHLHVHQLAELFTIVDLSTCHQKESFLTILIGHQHKVAYSWNLFNISRVLILEGGGHYVTEKDWTGSVTLFCGTDRIPTLFSGTLTLRGS